MNANRRAAAEQDRKTYREVTAFEKSLEFGERCGHVHT
jgi:hypothetical protein